MKNNYLKRIAIIAFICLLALALSGCSMLAGSTGSGNLFGGTEVVLPGGNSSNNILDKFYDNAFGSGDSNFADTIINGITGNITGTEPEPSATISLPSISDDSYLRIDFIDVGQASFVLIECDGTYMTIDGGNKADSQLVYSYLEQRNIEFIDTMVVTHAHEDHVGAASAILEKCKVNTVYCSTDEYDTEAFSDFTERVTEEGKRIIIPSPGDTFMLGTATVKILGPVGLYDDQNNSSIVLKITFGTTSFLFAGDIEETAEKDLLSAGFDLSADVLLVPHHGSSTSSSYVFLRDIMPKYCVIQSNREDAPEYDHPHNIVLSRLRDLGATVYRTDLQGTISCLSDGRNITFSVQKNPTANTLYELDNEKR